MSVLLKCHVHTNKAEPLVNEVELSWANPQYAHVRYADGKETTLSLLHLASFSEDAFGPNQIIP